MNKSDLKKVATNRELILAIILFLALLVIFYRFIYTPKVEAIDIIKKESVELDKKFKTLEIEIKALKKQKQLNASQTKVSNSENERVQILKGTNKAVVFTMSDLIHTITSQEVSQGLLIHSLATSNEVQDSGFKKTPLYIKTRGSYLGITNFLEKLDKLQALISIDAIYLEMDPMIKQDINLEVTTTLYQVEGIHETMATK